MRTKTPVPYFFYWVQNTNGLRQYNRLKSLILIHNQTEGRNRRACGPTLSTRPLHTQPGFRDNVNQAHKKLQAVFLVPNIPRTLACQIVRIFQEEYGNQQGHSRLLWEYFGNKVNRLTNESRIQPIIYPVLYIGTKSMENNISI